MTDQPALSYEQARDELAEVVRRLETGGTTLEESLTLWERGEQLADVCQQWLDGARARLDEPDQGNDCLKVEADLAQRVGHAVRRRHHFNNQIGGQSCEMLLISCPGYAMSCDEANVWSNQGVLVREDHEASVGSDNIAELVCLGVDIQEATNPQRHPRCPVTRRIHRNNLAIDELPVALRRVAFIRSAQRVGLSLEEITEALRTLPGGRTPTRADWARLSKQWRSRIDEQIERLERLRD